MSCQFSAAALETAIQNNAAIAFETPEGGEAWYVAYTEARQEILAVSNLQQQGFQTYLPLYRTLKRRPLRPAAHPGASGPLVVYEPMFPRYMFFKPSSYRQSISAVRSTRGVSSIVRFGASFALVQREILAAIQELEQQRNHSDLEAIDPLRPGRRIRLNNTSMQGLEGLVHSVSSKRIVVLMEILGRQTRVRVTPTSVEAV
jgi:transcriptional antiterminator RfaH